MEHSTYLDQFIQYMLTERRCSNCTATNYRADVERFLRYMEITAREFDPKAVTKNDLRSWLMAQMEAKVAVGSINRNLTTLRNFFRYLIRCEIIEANPAADVHAIKSGKRLAQFVEQSRMERLTRVLIEPSEEYPIERDAMIILLLYGCGLRRSEITELTTDSIDGIASSIGSTTDHNNTNATLKVFGKGAKERLIPLSPMIAQRLEHYLIVRNRENVCNSHQKALFLSNKAEPIQSHRVYLIVKEHLAAAGVQGRRSPHILRHSFATHLMQQGASIRSVQQLLGHESLAATQVYTHNTIEHLKKSYNKAHPRASTEIEKG